MSSTHVAKSSYSVKPPSHDDVKSDQDFKSGRNRQSADNKWPERHSSLPNIQQEGSREEIHTYSVSLSNLKRSGDFADYHFKPSPFYTRWVHGYNPKAGLINLNDKGSTILFYAASNFGILYDWTNNKMRILQGHRHIVTNIASDLKGEWIVTADSGAENVIIVWSNTDGFPHRTIFSPHRNLKLAKLALSADAKYLLTVAYMKDTVQLHWWIWAFEMNMPHAELEVQMTKDSILAMEFNPTRTEQFVLMTKHEIWIGVADKIVKERGTMRDTKNYQLKLRMVDRKPNAEIGRLTCFTYITTTSQVLVGTNRGYVLVHGFTMEYKLNADSSKYENLRYVKPLKVQAHKITVIKWVDNVVALGNNKGEIYFYDDQMKLLYWVHEFTVDSVSGLSFNVSPRSFVVLDPKCNKKCYCWEKVVVDTDPETGLTANKLLKTQVPSDATKGAMPFVIRDFIVCCPIQGIGFVDFVTEKNHIILDYKISPALALSVHPERKLAVIGYFDGHVELLNYQEHRVKARVNLRQFYTTISEPDDESIHENIETRVPKISVTCLKYSPSGFCSKVIGVSNLKIASLYFDGHVELLNYQEHRVKARVNLRQFYMTISEPDDESIHENIETRVPKISVTCLKYSPSGLHLACGLDNGQLLFLDPSAIYVMTKTPFHDTTFAIKEIVYSPDSTTLACADLGKTVCVYKFDCDSLKWNFIGKHRAHYKDITSLFFVNTKNSDGEYKLISFGLDRVMVEYDIGMSSNEYLEILSLDRVEQTAVPLGAMEWPDPGDLDPEECHSHLPLLLVSNDEYDIGMSSNEYLEILSLDRVEQTAVPLGAMEWPDPGDLDPEECHSHLPLLLVSNDEYKYKIVNYETTMTLATYLGPRFEHPVKQMMLVTKKTETETVNYLLFSTKVVIGLQQLPLDGNPWKHVGMLGHPNQLIKLCFRNDSGTLFTIGAKDNCMTQWRGNSRSVEKTSKLGGIDLDPYYCLIEDGRPGWLFQEVRDLFYYIQILCQGTFSPAMRKVKDVIPIDSLPDMMRALGFFLTEYEVENLLIEAKYEIYNKKPRPEIDFEEFVKLYINHRPAFLYTSYKIKDAFKNFAHPSKKEGDFIRRQEFIDILCSYGEAYTHELAWYLLSILSGQSFEDRANSSSDDFSFLPVRIKLGDLTTTILGIPDFDATSGASEAQSYGPSIFSEMTENSSADSDDDMTSIFYNL